jgi:hypothetical protein
MTLFYQKVFLVVVLFFLSFTGIAQTDFREGYIVNAKQDTIPGLIDYRGDVRNSRICRFKKNESAAPVEYTPYEILAYRFKDNKLYESKVIAIDTANQEQVFVETIVKGRVGLYFYKGATRDGKYYAGKGEEKLLELVKREYMVKQDNTNYIATDFRYRGILSYLMTDCKKVAKKIQRVKLEHKALVALINEYNSCFMTPEKVFNSSTPLVKVSVGVVGAMHYSKLKFRTSISSYQFLTQSPFEADQTGVFGGFINTTLPRVNEKLSLEIEAVYEKNRYTSYSQVKSFSSISHNDILIETRYLKFPVLLRYTYPKGRVRLYVNAGIAFSYGLQARNTLSQELEFSGIITPRESQAFSPRRSQQSLLVGAGVQSAFWGRKKVFVEVRAENGNSLTYAVADNKDLYSRATAINAIIGIGF